MYSASGSKEKKLQFGGKTHFASTFSTVMGMTKVNEFRTLRLEDVGRKISARGFRDKKYSSKKSQIEISQQISNFQAGKVQMCRGFCLPWVFLGSKFILNKHAKLT